MGISEKQHVNSLSKSIHSLVDQIMRDKVQELQITITQLKTRIETLEYIFNSSSVPTSFLQNVQENLNAKEEVRWKRANDDLIGMNNAKLTPITSENTNTVIHQALLEYESEIKEELHICDATTGGAVEKLRLTSDDFHHSVNENRHCREAVSNPLSEYHSMKNIELDGNKLKIGSMYNACDDAKAAVSEFCKKQQREFRISTANCKSLVYQCKNGCRQRQNGKGIRKRKCKNEYTNCPARITFYRNCNGVYKVTQLLNERN